MAEPADSQSATAATPAQPGVWVDPYRAYNFKLLINGAEEGHFTECSGLEVSIQPIRYRPGGMGPVVHMIPGPVEYAGVTLRYGLTASTALWDWFMAAASGQVQRKDISILILDTDGITEVVRWNLYDAWPSRWRGAPLNALFTEVAIESVTIVYDRLERE
jgi:phage tail-like protein